MCRCWAWLLLRQLGMWLYLQLYSAFCNNTTNQIKINIHLVQDKSLQIPTLLTINLFIISLI